MIPILYPVITRVPEAVKGLKGREKVAALSRLARSCAGASALEANLDVDQFEKDAAGVPLPSNGCFWSISHKPDVVAGIVSKESVGIDIEQIKEVSDALFKRIVDPEEWRHFVNPEKQLVFFRAFTAKEAVLKKTGDGIKGLSKAKVEKVVDDENLVVRYLNRKYWVENFYFDGYLASVTKDHSCVQWMLG